MGTIRESDEGTELIVDTGIDLSGAVDYKIKIRKPDGTIIAWIPSVYMDSYLKYTLKNGDIDQKGMWTVQSYIELPTGKWHGVKTTFIVDTILNVTV
jgi:hypothetical protein